MSPPYLQNLNWNQNHGHGEYVLGWSSTEMATETSDDYLIMSISIGERHNEGLLSLLPKDTGRYEIVSVVERPCYIQYIFAKKSEEIMWE